jgi:hypothetical protein
LMLGCWPLAASARCVLMCCQCTHLCAVQAHHPCAYRYCIFSKMSNAVNCQLVS